MTVAADASILQGAVTKCSVIGWKSSSLKRVARSSAAAEVQAANNGQEDLEYTRLAYFEISRGPINLDDPWTNVREIRGALVIDAKDVWDSCVKRESSALGMMDKRAAIEALALRQAIRWSNTELRWIHSEAMIADALTKCSAKAWNRLERFLSTGIWKLVDDPDFTSSKKRNQMGLDELADVPPDLTKQSLGMVLFGGPEAELRQLMPSSSSRGNSTKEKTIDAEKSYRFSMCCGNVREFRGSRSFRPARQREEHSRAF